MRLMLEDIGGWVKFPETMHEFYAHLAEMIGSEKKLYLFRYSPINFTPCALFYLNFFPADFFYFCLLFQSDFLIRYQSITFFRVE